MLTQEQARQLQSLINSKFVATDQLQRFGMGFTNFSLEHCVSSVKLAEEALNTFILEITEKDT